MPASRRRRSPSGEELRNGEPGSAHRPAILGQIRGRQPDRAPAAGRVGSRVHPLTRAEGDDLFRSHLDPAPDRRGSAADRQQHQEGVGGHHDKGDPRQVFLCSQQPQALQRDLGQPRPKPAGTGDQVPGNALLAQGSLKIIRFTKNRREGAWHFSSPPCSVAGLARPRGWHSNQVCEERPRLDYSISAEARRRSPKCSTSSPSCL